MPSAIRLSRATRAKTLPVMLSPVAVGAALAADRGARFSWGWLVVTLAGAAAMHLGANVLNDYFDERSGADKLARIDRRSIATGSGMIASGEMSAAGMLALAGALFGLGAAAGVALAVARGSAVLVLGAIGAALAIAYVAPPARYGYRGHGLGEVGIFAAFGLLPVLGSYYVQAQRLDGEAAWASVVPGMLTTLVLYHHHFLHWRADRASGKMTPVAVLGPETAMIVGGVAIVGVYTSLAIQVAIGLFPAWALAALATGPPLGAAWSRAMRDPLPQNQLNLLGATLGASVLTALAMSLALALA